MWSSIFYGIRDFFEEVLFLPYDFFRFMEGWWSSNLVNWAFIIIGFLALFYWLGRLNAYGKSEPEDKSITSHSYL